MDIKKEITEVLNLYKELVYNEDENKLIGKIRVAQEDYYNVIIDLDDYPNFLPSVKETLHRIPRKLDRHIYVDSGNLCFTTRAKADIILKTKIKSLKDFISLILIPYLRNNSYYEIQGKYFNAEYSHGSLGIIEAYRDILKINNVYKIARAILDRTRNKNLGFKDECYCGSGDAFKKCSNGKHNRAYREFKLIDDKILKYDLLQIIDYLKKED